MANKYCPVFFNKISAMILHKPGPIQVQEIEPFLVSSKTDIAYLTTILWVGVGNK